MPIVTVSREMGSRGDDIAVAVAAELNLRLVGRELITRAARQAGVPEVALAEIDEMGLLGVKPSSLANRQYRETVETIVHELAGGGNVLIVGRGGQMILAGWPEVLHVRVIAPLEARIRTVVERCRVMPEAAAARVSASDKASAGYLRRHYGVRWNDPALYDIVINMAQLDVGTAVALVGLAAARKANVAQR